MHYYLTLKCNNTVLVWGGIFERMIRLMKRCLRKAIGRAHDEQPTTLAEVSEVEIILNSRPLSY